MKKTDDETKFIKSKKTKFAEFISKNSVYGIFAVVLIAICAITLLSLPRSPKDNGDEPDPTQIVDADPTVRPTNNPRPSATLKPPVPATPTPGQVAENTPLPPPTPTPGNQGGISEVNNEPKTGFSIILPFAKSTIITPYSNDTPIYSDTLQEWSCHVGIDFSCSTNDIVPAAANGIVVSVSTDDIYGTSVLIEHEDNFYTLYRGLKEAAVKADELVAEGQSLGTASENIPFEAHIPTHIHFEVIKDNLSVNPLSFAK